MKFHYHFFIFDFFITYKFLNPIFLMFYILLILYILPAIFCLLLLLQTQNQKRIKSQNFSKGKIPNLKNNWMAICLAESLNLKGRTPSSFLSRISNCLFHQIFFAHLFIVDIKRNCTITLLKLLCFQCLQSLR